MNELYHFGIKGMHWGVRRYQNEDGSLTAKGKARLNSKTPRSLNKEFRGYIHKQRRAKGSDGERTGWSNQWLVSNHIGENSKKAHQKQRAIWDADDKKYTSLYKNAKSESEKERIISQYEQRQVDTGRARVLGVKATQQQMKAVGDVNVAYLKDLGFNDSAAKYINKRASTLMKPALY